MIARFLMSWHSFSSIFAHINNGLEFDKNTLIGRFITARLEVDFKKPTPE
ncbi:MAG: hypothetical protein ACLT9V_01580 [Anaerococcus obesiensis]